MNNPAVLAVAFNCVAPSGVPTTIFCGAGQVMIGVWTLATETDTDAEVVVLPASSRAIAVSMCAPLALAAVFHCIVYGGAVSSGPKASPSSRNCTPTTATLSDAVEESAIVPLTLAPFAGAVNDTVGAVTSGAAANE